MSEYTLEVTERGDFIKAYTILTPKLTYARMYAYRHLEWLVPRSMVAIFRNGVKIGYAEKDESGEITYTSIGKKPGRYLLKATGSVKMAR